MERPRRPDLIEEAALKEIADYQRQERRKRVQPSVRQKEAMEILLAKLKEEGIEAKGKVGFITLLTTPVWNIVFIGAKKRRTGRNHNIL